MALSPLTSNFTFRSAVQHLALHKMSVAFRGWQCLVAWRQHMRKEVEGAVVRLSQRSMAQALAAWRQCVAEQRVARHRVAVCQRRQQTGTLRAVLRVWRRAAAVRAAERQAVQLCQKRANRIRCVCMWLFYHVLICLAPGWQRTAETLHH